jgi:hypothetical protein
MGTWKRSMATGPTPPCHTALVERSRL